MTKKIDELLKEKANELLKEARAALDIETTDKGNKVATKTASCLIALAKATSTWAEDKKVLGSDAFTLATSAADCAQELLEINAKDPAKPAKLVQAALTAKRLAQNAIKLYNAGKALDDAKTTGTSCCGATLKLEAFHPMDSDEAKDDNRLKVIRESIKHENELFHHRRTNFGILQGLLWNSAAALATDIKKNFVLAISVAVAGAFLALSAAFAFRMSELAIKRLTKMVPLAPDERPVRGLDGDEIDCSSCDKALIIKCNDPSIGPVTLLATWAVFITFLWFSRSDTMEIANVENVSVVSL